MRGWLQPRYLGSGRMLFGLLLGLAGIVQAGVRVEIEGIDNALRENVRVHVGEPVTDDPQIVRRFARRIPELAREAMEALGYYDAEARVFSERDGEIRVLRLVVTPGEPVRIASVQVGLEGEAGQDAAFLALLNHLPLREGDRLHHGQYGRLIRAIENMASARGYFDGRFLVRRIEVDRAAHRADVIVRYDSGPRYRMGAVHFPETPLREVFLQRLVPFEAGTPYHVELLTRFNRNLLSSGYFSDVRVRPKHEEAGADLQVPVEAMVVADAPNRIGVGVGVTTDVGPRVRLNWRRPWVNRHGHIFVAETELSEVRQNASLQYTVPLKPPLTHRLQFMGGWQSEDLKDTRSEKRTAGVQRERVLAGGWQMNNFLRWEQERFTQADVRGDSTLLLPGVGFSRTRARGGVNPDRGDHLFASVEGAHPAVVSDIYLARLRLQGKILRSAGRHRGLARVEYGALTTEDFQRTPPSLRFFAGGDQSVRGYGYQSLSPRDDEGRLTGGRYLLVGSLEYSYAFAEKWRAAVFVDSGNASMDSTFSEGLEQGVGTGIRWLTPVGPLRVDLAWGVSDPDRPWRVHLSMGAEL